MSHAHRPNEKILAAWQEQVTGAARQPLLARVLMERSCELLPRFAHFHEALWTLSRHRRRAIQHRFGMTLSAVALMLALGSEPTPAAIIRVDGTNCTLIDAIIAANTDKKSGGCPAGNAADTLELIPNSTHSLTSVNTDFRGPTGLPIVTSEILIEGNDAVIERDKSASEFRILAVNAEGKLTLKEAKVTGGSGVALGGGLFVDRGDLTLANSIISGNAASSGGAVSSHVENSNNYADSTLTIVNSTISGNSGSGIDVTAMNSYGGIESTITDSIISGNSGNGIDIHNINHTRSTLVITNSTISDNSAGVYAYSHIMGGNTTTIINSNISDNSGPGVLSESDGDSRDNITIANSIISDNRGSGVAAGAGSRSGTGVNITSSTISGNSTAWSGAGVSADVGFDSSINLTITNSTVSGNSAAENGGGVSTSGSGGGEYGGQIDLNISDSTITGNTANKEGGGVHVSSYTPAYSNQTVVTFNHSIITANAASSGQNVIIKPTGHAAVTTTNFNLFGFDNEAGIEGFLPGPTDIIPLPDVLIPDILGPLTDNGGPARTHALVEGSPAIDAIPTTEPGCEGVDQRGLSRPQDGDADGVSACDIGAYEVAGPETVPFAHFDIIKARVKLAKRVGRDAFKVEGSFSLLAENNGVDVLNEEVAVTFNGFTETVPPASFHPLRDEEKDDDKHEGFRGRHFYFRSPMDGIRWFKLSVGRDKGYFLINAKGLELEELELPTTVLVALRIGNDIGYATIPLNRNGLFIGRDNEEENETD